MKQAPSHPAAPARCPCAYLSKPQRRTLEKIEGWDTNKDDMAKTAMIPALLRRGFIEMVDEDGLGNRKYAMTPLGRRVAKNPSYYPVQVHIVDLEFVGGQYDFKAVVEVCGEEVGFGWIRTKAAW